MHGVAVSHGSYEELLNNPEVEVVYVSTIHHLHIEHAMQCLQAGKHVVIEKPIALTLDDATALVKEANKRDLFLMEGMWTR